MRVRWLVVAALALAACSQAPETAPGGEAVQDRSSTLTGQGIMLASTPIPFGTPAAAAEESLRKAWGDPDSETDWGPVKTDWGYCGGTTLKVLEWQGLKVLLSDAVGAPGLTGWRWDASGGPAGAQIARDFSPTSPAFQYGDTIAVVRSAYPNVHAPPRKLFGNYVFSVWHTRMVRDTPILESGVVGQLSSNDPASATVEVAEAGALCAF